jgi:hypothetical protein
MKHTIALLVLCTFVSSTVRAEGLMTAGWSAAALQTASCDASREKGNAAAGDHNAVGWFFGGVGAGFALGLIGTGAITAGSAFTAPKPHTIPQDVDEACYKDGYRSHAKKKNITGAVLGGVIGTAAITTIILVNCNYNSFNRCYRGF